MIDDIPDNARGFGRWLEDYRAVLSPETVRKATLKLLALRSLEQPRVPMPLVESAIADSIEFDEAYEADRLSL